MLQILFFEFGKVFIELGSLITTQMFALVVEPAVKHVCSAFFSHHALIVIFKIAENTEKI